LLNCKPPETVKDTPEEQPVEGGDDVRYVPERRVAWGIRVGAANAVASASTSISDFDFGFAPTTTPVSSVSTAVNQSGSVVDTSITPTNSLGILVAGGSSVDASFLGANTLDFNTGTFQWRLPPVNVQADATAETGSNITAHATAILDQDISFTITSGSAQLSLSGTPTAVTSAFLDFFNTTEAAIGEATVSVALYNNNHDVLTSQQVLGIGVAVGFPNPPSISDPLTNIIFPTVSSGTYTLELQLGALATAVDTVPITAAPEPSSLAIAVTGLLGLGFLRRRAP
jgi:hypothetical protein